MSLIRADLHVHTCYSPDSKTTFDQLIETCRKRKIDYIAVTDHNSLEGSIKLSQIAPFRVIPSEEVKTASGEVIGFFLKEQIPRGLSAADTAVAIRAQGGLVCIPHPFDRVRKSRITLGALREIMPYVDIIEGFNARTTLLRDSDTARVFAASHGLPTSAGSDAHHTSEIGRTYVEMAPFDTKEEFLANLSKGKLVAVRSNPLVHVLSMWAKHTKR